MLYGAVDFEVIDIADEIAVGATRAQTLVAPLFDRLRREPRRPVTVFVDFSAVEAANTSFIKAAYLELIWWGQRYADSEDAFRVVRDSANVFPVLRGLRDEVREEVITALISEGLAALEAHSVHHETIVRGQTLGRLEDALRATLDALTKEGFSTATSLCERYPSKKPVQPTAWNNRLVELHRLRLVTRERSGRQWIYQALTKELVYG